MIRNVLLLTMGAAVAAVPSGIAHAEVRNLSDQGFVIEQERTVAATPDQLFAALSRPAEWWDSEHSWSGDAANFSFETRAGGCWCERLSDGGSVEHGRILMFHPQARAIILHSQLGPLLETAQQGLLVWRVEPVAGEAARARLLLSYRVALHPSLSPATQSTLAAAVDGVLGQQLDRLAAFAAGQPMPPAE